MGTLGGGNHFTEVCLDEIPGACKDIDQVMENQSDLTEILHTLKQVVCV